MNNGLCCEQGRFIAWVAETTSHKEFPGHMVASRATRMVTIDVMWQMRSRSTDHSDLQDLVFCEFDTPCGDSPTDSISSTAHSRRSFTGILRRDCNARRSAAGFARTEAREIPVYDRRGRAVLAVGVRHEEFVTHHPRCTIGRVRGACRLRRARTIVLDASDERGTGLEDLTIEFMIEIAAIKTYRRPGSAWPEVDRSPSEKRW